ncbi:MAG: T9SS type A sorting domain-containing protein, partial [Ignavibacteriales bacterium]|nr:T9SS type A sorting domain-containing protein [Ignavibacteriales bacterium]
STNGGSTWKLSTINKNGAPINSRAVFVSEETSERDIKGESPKSPTSTSAINSIQMLTEQMGYAVGSNSAVYKTTNGGMTWDSLTTTITAAMNLSKVFFLNANIGWVTSKTANASGTIFKTTDAGATWTQQSLGNGLTGSSTQVYGFQMLNENVGWALNYTPRPYKTTDGGATWTLQNLVDNFGGFLYDVKMFDENNGFLVGSSGRVYKTTNSGTNWDTVSIPTRSYALYKLLFVDANNAFISGATGTIFKSTNGGSTWDLENTAGSTMYSIAASGVNNGEVTLFSVGTLGYGFKRTLSVTTPTTITVTAPNGGETWVSGSTKNITWSSSGVANVKIELTTDNGTTWSTISASTPATPASYSWTVPAVNSTQCKIMISDVANAAINDMSNASFSITTAVLIDIPMSVAAGWNMAAVSVLAPNMTASVLFSGSNASVFGFDNGYVAVTDLMNGKGYWVRYAAPATFTISGTAVASTTVPIVTGWNMVGIYKDTVTVAGITTTPAGIVNSNYFGFDNGYVNAAKLAPGKGYWVRATQAGTLNLPTPTAKFGVGNTAVNSTGKIIITDKNGKTGVLYSATSESELNRSDLPPVPPVGTFDVRFATQRNAAVFGSDKQLVNIEGAQYPVTLRSEGLTLAVTDRATNGKLLNATLANGQSIVINDASMNAIEIGATLAPVAFELSQNYPNPFNPSTIIRFTLPEKSRMSLTVYNQLGQKVATIADGIKEAGSYNVEFNGSQLSSGVYFYELKTEKNTAIKKLMLMK